MRGSTASLQGWCLAPTVGGVLKNWSVKVALEEVCTPDDQKAETLIEVTQKKPHVGLLAEIFLPSNTQHTTHSSATRLLDTQHLKPINKPRLYIYMNNPCRWGCRRQIPQFVQYNRIQSASVHFEDYIHSFQQTITGCASGKCAGGVDPSACLLWEGWGERTGTSPLPQLCFRDADVRNDGDGRVWLRGRQTGH